MNKKNLNELVGKSFEDLTVDEMRELQGAADVTVDSTPTVIIPISTIEISEAVSVLVSAISAASVTYTVSKARKCDK